MTIHVNIGEVEKRFPQLVAAAVRGEEVVVAKDGVPQVRLVPVETVVQRERADVFGVWRDAFTGFDTSIDGLKASHEHPDERFRRKFGPAG